MGNKGIHPLKFKLKNNNDLYEIKVYKDEENNYLTIETKDYSRTFGVLDFLTKTLINVKTLDELYELIISLFQNNKVSIVKIIKNFSIKLFFKCDFPFEMALVRTDNKPLPKLKEIKSIKDSYENSTIGDSFIVFISINNISYLIYSNIKKSIICYNLYNFTFINEIKEAHDDYITNLRHYLDKLNQRDLLLSISRQINNIKVWNCYNFECILCLKNINSSGELYSACILNNNNQIYIITSNISSGRGGIVNKLIISIFEQKNPIKIFDLNGEKIEEINDLKENTISVDVLNHENKNYIITGNKGFLTSYDYTNKKLYHIYKSCGYETCYHECIINNNNKNIIKLIDFCHNRLVTVIWHFQSGTRLNYISYGTNPYAMCLWNNDYIIISNEFSTYAFYDDYKRYVLPNIRNISTIKKYIHPKIGDCLIYKEHHKNGRIIINQINLK